MGTDIHMYTEALDDSGVWRCASPIQTAREEWPTLYKDAPASSKGANQPRMLRTYRRRNYDLFAILANVRNGSGFAGCDTGDPFNVIAEPLGLPRDMSDGLRRACGIKRITSAGEPEYQDRDDDTPAWLGEHSFSWLTLTEIFGFDWQQTRAHRAYVDLHTYAKWRVCGGWPDEYSGDVSGSGIKKVSAAEMDAALAELTESRAWHDQQKALADTPRRAELIGMYTKVSWTTTYAEAAEDFWAHAVSKLARIHPEAPHRVRIVFGFDS